MLLLHAAKSELQPRHADIASGMLLQVDESFPQLLHSFGWTDRLDFDGFIGLNGCR
jgi:hypothetical protein